jgi:hypothetical protein
MTVRRDLLLQIDTATDIERADSFQMVKLRISFTDNSGTEAALGLRRGTTTPLLV